jgi:hypothetical protein
MCLEQVNTYNVSCSYGHKGGTSLALSSMVVERKRAEDGTGGVCLRGHEEG